MKIRVVAVAFLGVFSSWTVADHNAAAIDHAPIGVMADHFHAKGEYMLSVRRGVMDMAGNILDGDSIADADIITRANPLGSVPPNLSVVPIDMDMAMTMVGAMYAPSDKVTLMGMLMLKSRGMNHNTYRGGGDRALLGTFRTSSDDLSDISVGALIKLRKTESTRTHVNVSLMQSIGESEQVGTVLTPLNTQADLVMPYAMQVSDGATRLALGLTQVSTIATKVVWGNQVSGKFVLAKDDWAFGNELELNSWLQYEVQQTLSLSARLKVMQQDSISGMNPSITAPVQTANPANYGGLQMHLGIGLNFVLPQFIGKSDRVAIEFVKPLVQDKNGLQMETSQQLVIGYQVAF